MIISECAEAEWKSRNRKQYEKLGYTFTNYGEKFYIKISDLPKCSHYKVKYSCDNCKKIGELSYKDYLKSVVDGKKYCRSCAAKLLAATKRNDKYLKTGVSKTFYDYICEEFGEDYFKYIWDTHKNIISPKEIFYSSKNKVWLKCTEHPHHNFYLTTANEFTHGRRCPYCKNKKVHFVDSLGVKFKKCLYVWSNKNIKSPFDYSPHSNKIVWWKCENKRHNDYQRSINHSSIINFRCPHCVQESNCSLLQNVVNNYITKELCYDVKHEFDCSIIPINPKTGKQLPFDNEIVDLKLIIEVHGKQHYIVNGYNEQNAKRYNTTPQEQLDYQKWKDKFKCNYALEHGYFFLEIPYTAYEDENYKTLIDNKIKEITEVINND